MTRSALTPVLAEAVAAGRAVAAFNVIQLEHAEAYAAAAERVGLPVVMQISENCVRYHGSLAPIAAATLAIADACTQPVVVHLDHAEDVALVEEAVRLGLTSVMFDGSTLPDDENRAVTRRVVELCRAAGVSVEAELGEVGGKDGVHAPGVRTDPADAARFVADTGVDALAVAVGSSHAMTDRTAELDTDLIAALRRLGPGAARAARLVRGARRGSRRRGAGRHDEGQHRHAPQPGLHAGDDRAARGVPDGRHEEVPRRGPRRRHRRGRPPDAPPRPPLTPHPSKEQFVGRSRRHCSFDCGDADELLFRLERRTRGTGQVRTMLRREVAGGVGVQAGRRRPWRGTAGAAARGRPAGRCRGARSGHRSPAPARAAPPAPRRTPTRPVPARRC